MHQARWWPSTTSIDGVFIVLKSIILSKLREPNVCPVDKPSDYKTIVGRSMPNSLSQLVEKRQRRDCQKLSQWMTTACPKNHGRSVCYKGSVRYTDGLLFAALCPDGYEHQVSGWLLVKRALSRIRIVAFDRKTKCLLQRRELTCVTSWTMLYGLLEMLLPFAGLL